MATVAIDFGAPNAVQQRALDLFTEGKRIVTISTGRQVGKSHFGARWLISQVFSPNAKHKLGAVIVPTFRHGRVAVRKIEELLRIDPDFHALVDFRQQPIPTYFFPNGWIIEVHSAHDPDSLRGPSFDAVWYDEVALGTRESFNIIMPTLLAAGGKFLGTTTPRGRQNWAYRSLWVKGAPEGHIDHKDDQYNPIYGVVQGSITENAEYLDELAVETLRDQYGIGTAFELQEVQGLWVNFEGLVYQWDEGVSYVSIEDMPEVGTMSFVIGGLDFGWVDPTAAYVMGYKEGQWFVFDGLYQEQMGINELADNLAVLTQNYGVGVWYADSARPDSISDLAQRGLPVQPVAKPRIEERVREMAQFTDKYNFKVSTRCPEIRAEFGMYQYPEEDKLMRDKNRNPVDAHNHAMDALGYGLWSNRWLWRNAVSTKPPNKTDEEDPMIEKLKEYNRGRSTKSSGPAGLYNK